MICSCFLRSLSNSILVSSSSPSSSVLREMNCSLQPFFAGGKGRGDKRKGLRYFKRHLCV